MVLAFHDKIGASLFQKCGTRTRATIVDIRKVAATLVLTFAGRTLACIHLLAVILLVPLLGKGRQMP